MAGYLLHSRYFFEVGLGLHTTTLYFWTARMEAAAGGRRNRRRYLDARKRWFFGHTAGGAEQLWFST